MTALRILALCISAAFICAAIRSQHPQIASAVALAAGIAALMLSAGDLSALSETLRRLEFYAEESGLQHGYLLKVCGIAVVAEFASDICRDGGEAALAHRIDTGVKLAITASALPTVMEILDHISSLLQ